MGDTGESDLHLYIRLQYLLPSFFLTLFLSSDAVLLAITNMFILIPSFFLTLYFPFLQMRSYSRVKNGGDGDDKENEGKGGEGGEGGDDDGKDSSGERRIAAPAPQAPMQFFFQPITLEQVCYYIFQSILCSV